LRFLEAEYLQLPAPKSSRRADGGARVPKGVIRQAKKYPQLLEDSSVSHGNQEDLLLNIKLKSRKTPEADPARCHGKMNPDDLTSREVLELLYRLKRFSCLAARRATR
jgi:hypothetical protein